ncbi:hypothetical protein [Pedobacter sandarakinus]|uniref:hypothetical protein n=1 Tax=Pedobacter sandarakinus TaxID=353156 RepID=UPI002245780C|nr:hypothetical protein [Pedobacter sandarakinus]MCX2576379.1 hypothetical protein [Pedobacter sandarakinus]
MDTIIKLKRNNAVHTLFLLLFSLPVYVFSQIPTVVNDQIIQCRVIFKADYPLELGVNVKERFTPSSEDVKKGELIVLENSNIKLQKYIMQYLGYINSNGDKILLVNMLKDLGSKKNKLYYKDWSSEFILGFGKIYEKNTLLQKANLSTGQLEGF